MSHCVDVGIYHETLTFVNVSFVVCVFAVQGMWHVQNWFRNINNRRINKNWKNTSDRKKKLTEIGKYFRKV